MYLSIECQFKAPLGVFFRLLGIKHDYLIDMLHAHSYFWS